MSDGVNSSTTDADREHEFLLRELKRLSSQGKFVQWSVVNFCGGATERELVEMLGGDPSEEFGFTFIIGSIRRKPT